MKVNTNQTPTQTSQEEAPAAEVKLGVDEGRDLQCCMLRVKRGKDSEGAARVRCGAVDAFFIRRRYLRGKGPGTEINVTSTPWT